MAILPRCGPWALAVSPHPRYLSGMRAGTHLPPPRRSGTDDRMPSPRAGPSLPMRLRDLDQRVPSTASVHLSCLRLRVRGAAANTRAAVGRRRRTQARASPRPSHRVEPRVGGDRTRRDRIADLGASAPKARLYDAVRLVAGRHATPIGWVVRMLDQTAGTAIGPAAAEKDPHRSKARYRMSDGTLPQGR